MLFMVQLPFLPYGKEGARVCGNNLRRRSNLNDHRNGLGNLLHLHRPEDAQSPDESPRRHTPNLKCVRL
jgi:hypothetical protein